MTTSSNVKPSQQGELTDAAIDALSGVELRDAVLSALGWTRTFGGWDAPGRGYMANRALPNYHTDTGAALGLLSRLEDADIDISFCRDGTVTIVKHGETYFVILASGPKVDLAKLCCVAFLKMTSGS